MAGKKKDEEPVGGDSTEETDYLVGSPMERGRRGWVRPVGMYRCGYGLCVLCMSPEEMGVGEKNWKLFSFGLGMSLPSCCEPGERDTKGGGCLLVGHLALTRFLLPGLRYCIFCLSRIVNRHRP